jgi:hypothetical protein
MLHLYIQNLLFFIEQASLEMELYFRLVYKELEFRIFLNFKIFDFVDNYC